MLFLKLMLLLYFCQFNYNYTSVFTRILIQFAICFGNLFCHYQAKLMQNCELQCTFAIACCNSVQACGGGLLIVGILNLYVKFLSCAVFLSI